MNHPPTPNKENFKRHERVHVDCSGNNHVFVGYETAHQVEVKREILDLIPSGDSTKPNPNHGKATMQAFPGATSNNPYAVKGNYYDLTGQEGNDSIFMHSRNYNNAPMAGFGQPNANNPSAQSVDHPFYMGSSGNVVLGPDAISGPTVNPQFDAGNTQFLMDGFFTHKSSNHTNECNLPFHITNPSYPGYNHTDFGMVKGPSFFKETKTHNFLGSNNPNVVEPKTNPVGSKNGNNSSTNISDRGKKHNLDEVQETSAMMRAPKRANFTIFPPLSEEREKMPKELTFTLMNEQRVPDFPMDGASSASAVESTKEEDDVDLDLHL